MRDGFPIFLGSVVLAALVLGALTLPEMDARIWQAIVAGLFVAVGWVVNGWRDRRDAARLRAEKLRDYHKALFAEIRTTLAALDEDDPSQGEATAARISDTFKPFVPRERHDRVYEHLIGDIDVLPRQTIDAVVAYYSQIQAVQSLADDLRAVDLSEIGPDRVAPMYRDYLRMRRFAFAYGEIALELIDVYSKVGAAAAEARAAEIVSSRGAARDVRPRATGRA